jgi:hypothetical protein
MIGLFPPAPKSFILALTATSAKGRYDPFAARRGMSAVCAKLTTVADFKNTAFLPTEHGPLTTWSGDRDLN